MFESFSRRKALAAKTGPDVYQYEDMPNKLRVQLVHLFQAMIGTGTPAYNNRIGNIWEVARDRIREEEGHFKLPYQLQQSKYAFAVSEELPEEELLNYFLQIETDKALDVVELLCRMGEKFCVEPHYAGKSDAKDHVIGCISSINRRFRESCVGYQFEDGQIVQVDSDLMHKDAVRPALEVLRLPGYAGAQSEFLVAHEHYRHGRNSEAVVECHKAFESMMKAICTKRKWKFDATKSASHLVEVCITNGLLQRYQQTSLTGLRSLLESAIPTPRNKSAAHGAGVVPVSVPDELASYVIHLSASTLLFLANSERTMR